MNPFCYLTAPVLPPSGPMLACTASSVWAGPLRFVLLKKKKNSKIGLSFCCFLSSRFLPGRNPCSMVEKALVCRHEAAPSCPSTHAVGFSALPLASPKTFKCEISKHCVLVTPALETGRHWPSAHSGKSHQYWFLVTGWPSEITWKPRYPSALWAR